jgi:hypothetical protein
MKLWPKDARPSFIVGGAIFLDFTISYFIRHGQESNVEGFITYATKINPLKSLVVLPSRLPRATGSAILQPPLTVNSALRNPRILHVSQALR